MKYFTILTLLCTHLLIPFHLQKNSKMNFNLGDSFKKFSQSVKEVTGMTEPTRDPQEVLDASAALKSTSKDLNDLYNIAKRWYTRELDAIEGMKVFASAASVMNGEERDIGSVRTHLPAMLSSTASARSELLTHFKAEFLDVLSRFIDNELRIAEKAWKKNADARLDYDSKNNDFIRLNDSKSARPVDIDVAKRKYEEADQAYSSARRDFLTAAETCQERKTSLFKTNIATIAQAMIRASSDINDAALKLSRDCD